MMEELTAEEAENAVSEIIGMVDIPIPQDYQSKMAAFMLIIADICRGTCQCDSCQRAREIFEDV